MFYMKRSANMDLLYKEVRLNKDKLTKAKQSLPSLLIFTM